MGEKPNSDSPPEGLCSNDLRVSLTALRAVLVERLLGAEPRESAALARQLELVMVRLASLPGMEQSDLDDLAAKREKRRASVPKHPAGGVVGG